MDLLFKIMLNKLRGINRSTLVVISIYNIKGRCFSSTLIFDFILNNVPLTLHRFSFDFLQFYNNSMYGLFENFKISKSLVLTKNSYFSGNRFLINENIFFSNIDGYFSFDQIPLTGNLENSYNTLFFYKEKPINSYSVISKNSLLLIDKIDNQNINLDLYESTLIAENEVVLDKEFIYINGHNLLVNRIEGLIDLVYWYAKTGFFDVIPSFLVMGTWFILKNSQWSEPFFFFRTNLYGNLINLRLSCELGSGSESLEEIFFGELPTGKEAQEQYDGTYNFATLMFKYLAHSNFHSTSSGWLATTLSLLSFDNYNEFNLSDIQEIMFDKKFMYLWNYGRTKTTFPTDYFYKSSLITSIQGNGKFLTTPTLIISSTYTDLDNDYTSYYTGVFNRTTYPDNMIPNGSINLLVESAGGTTTSFFQPNSTFTDSLEMLAGLGMYTTYFLYGKFDKFFEDFLPYCWAYTAEQVGTIRIPIFYLLGDLQYKNINEFSEGGKKLILHYFKQFPFKELQNSENFFFLDGIDRLKKIGDVILEVEGYNTIEKLSQSFFGYNTSGRFYNQATWLTSFGDSYDPYLSFFQSFDVGEDEWRDTYLGKLMMSWVEPNNYFQNGNLLKNSMYYNKNIVKFSFSSFLNYFKERIGDESGYFLTSLQGGEIPTDFTGFAWNFISSLKYIENLSYNHFSWDGLFFKGLNVVEWQNFYISVKFPYSIMLWFEDLCSWIENNNIMINISSILSSTPMFHGTDISFIGSWNLNSFLTCEISLLVGFKNSVDDKGVFFFNLVLNKIFVFFETMDYFSGFLVNYFSEFYFKLYFELLNFFMSPVSSILKFLDYSFMFLFHITSVLAYPHFLALFSPQIKKNLYYYKTLTNDWVYFDRYSYTAAWYPIRSGNLRWSIIDYIDGDLDCWKVFNDPLNIIVGDFSISRIAYYLEIYDCFISTNFGYINLKGIDLIFDSFFGVLIKPIIFIGHKCFELCFNEYNFTNFLENLKIDKNLFIENIIFNIKFIQLMLANYIDKFENYFNSWVDIYVNTFKNFYYYKNFSWYILEKFFFFFDFGDGKTSLNIISFFFKYFLQFFNGCLVYIYNDLFITYNYSVSSKIFFNDDKIIGAFLNKVQVTGSSYDGFFFYLKYNFILDEKILEIQNDKYFYLFNFSFFSNFGNFLDERGMLNKQMIEKFLFINCWYEIQNFDNLFVSINNFPIDGTNYSDNYLNELYLLDLQRFQTYIVKPKLYHFYTYPVNYKN